MKILITTAVVFISIFLLSATINAQPSPATVVPAIRVYQFHLEHRCVSCRKIELFTKTTLSTSFPSLNLTLINVEDKKNQKLASEFQVFGSALFLYNPITGKKKNLTEFAFLNVGNETQFKAGLKKQIEEFLKG
jgi:hypothetical protein